MTRLVFLFAVLGAAAACSSAPPQTPYAQISGTIGGDAIPLTDAIGHDWTFSTAGGTNIGVEIVATNKPNFCALLSANTGESNLEMFTVGVYASAFNAAPPTIGPGTYTIGCVGGAVSCPTNAPSNGSVWGPSAAASLSRTDASCKFVSQDGGSSGATSGTVTLIDAADAAAGTSSRLAGSFDLYFGQDHVTGTFDAPVCNQQFPLGLTLTDPHTCQ